MRLIARKTPFGGASAVPLAALALLGLAACAPGGTSMQPTDLTDFAARYAAAWSGGNPEALASFYTEDGSLTVNDGEPSIGREAIAAKAGSFMDGFPDMVVRLQSVTPTEGGATFHWRWTGTNTGPGGTGRAVDLTGYEEWTFGDGGLIAVSDGHYDGAEYERQVTAEDAGSPS